MDFLRGRVGGRLTLKTVLMIAIQVIEKIEIIHSKGYIHGDIQPSNFLTGTGKTKHKIYLIDYELSYPYLVNGKHIS